MMSKDKERLINNININSVIDKQSTSSINNNDEQKIIKQCYKRLRKQI